MAQLISVRLSRVDAQPWGLRLQGGKDFGTPLVIQKVSKLLYLCIYLLYIFNLLISLQLYLYIIFYS